MRARELKRWLAEAERLTPAQQEQVLARLQGRRSQDLVARLLSEHAPMRCPHCSDTRISLAALAAQAQEAMFQTAAVQVVLERPLDVRRQLFAVVRQDRSFS